VFFPGIAGFWYGIFVRLAMARSRLELQPTEGQYAHVLRAANLAGCSMAAYLRILIVRDMERDAKRRRRSAVKGLPRTRLQQ
jgi:hypothetical protein